MYAHTFAYMNAEDHESFAYEVVQCHPPTSPKKIRLNRPGEYVFSDITHSAGDAFLISSGSECDGTEGGWEPRAKLDYA